MEGARMKAPTGRSTDEVIDAALPGLRRAKFLRTQAAWLADQPFGTVLEGRGLFAVMKEADDAYASLNSVERAFYAEWIRPEVQKVLANPEFRKAAVDVWSAFFGEPGPFAAKGDA